MRNYRPIEELLKTALTLDGTFRNDEEFKEFICYLDFYELKIENIIEDTSDFPLFERYIESDNGTLDGCMDLFRYAVSTWDNFGRTAESVARAYFSDCYNPEEDLELIEESVAESLARVNDNCIFESGDYIFMEVYC